MLLKAINNGAVAGTATVTCESGVLGGVLVTTDGTNAAVITVQKDTAAGKKVFDISSLVPVFIKAPMTLEGTTSMYYSVTGTGAKAQFFEWIE